MKVSLFISLLLGTMCFQKSAQSKQYAAYLHLGVAKIEDSKYVLPSIVPGISGFSKSYYGIGGEFEYKINSLILDGEIQIMAHGPLNNGIAYAEPFEASLTGKAGIVLFESKNILFYPVVGTGLSGLFINTYTKAEGLKSNLHSSYILTPAIDLGLNGDVVVYRLEVNLQRESFQSALEVAISLQYNLINGKEPPAQISANNYLLTAASISQLP